MVMKLYKKESVAFTLAPLPQPMGHGKDVVIYAELGNEEVYYIFDP